MIIYKPFSKIKAMTFDLDDTLYDNWPYLIEAEKALLNYISTSYSQASSIGKEHWQGYKREALRNNPNLFSDMGVLRKKVLTQGLSEAGYEGEVLEKAVNDCFDYFYFERSNFKVQSEKVTVLEKLAQRVPLIAITNGNVNLAQIGIEHCFQTTYKASLSSPMKPHPHMFSLAIAELGLAPKHILHVGDNLEKDVLGATQVGMTSAWHACDRNMDIHNEKVHVLPHVEIHGLPELLEFV